MKNLVFALALSPLALTLGCAGANAVKKPAVEVTYQASTDITDDGAQINGKLCFGETHFDRSEVPNSNGAIDLLGWNRHFVIGQLSATENRVVGAIAGRGGHGTGARPSSGAQPGAAGSQEDRRNQLGSTGGPRGSEENEAVDLRYSLDHLIGRVGWHQFAVKTVGDHMEGQYQFNAMNPVNIKLWGMDKLWALPLAEQGVLLPSLLHCLQKIPTHDFEMTLADLVRKS